MFSITISVVEENQFVNVFWQGVVGYYVLRDASPP